MDNIDKTTEPQLRDFDAAGVIVGARIVKSDDGYVLVIQVSWKPGELVVFSQRGRPRAWVSMDRLLRYIQEVTPTIKQIEVVLGAAPEWAHSKKRQPVRRAPAKKASVRKRSPAGRPRAAD